MRHATIPARSIPGAVLGTALVAAVLAVGLVAPRAEAQATSQVGARQGGSDAARAVIESVAQTDPALAKELEAIHAATAKYLDVEAALADGYIRDPMDMCITPEMEGMPRQMGGMGIHYFRPDLLGITAAEPRVDGVGTNNDFRQPGVLVYEPQADGSLALVAVENLIFREAWRAAGNDGPPEFMGNQYYALTNNPETDIDEAHGFMPHYELHMWLYRENPNGLFSQFNPNVTCEHHSGGHEGH